MVVRKLDAFFKGLEIRIEVALEMVSRSQDRCERDHEKEWMRAVSLRLTELNVVDIARDLTLGPWISR
jgi:hypothetical protein